MSDIRSFFTHKSGGPGKKSSLSVPPEKADSKIKKETFGVRSQAKKSKSADQNASANEGDDVELRRAGSINQRKKRVQVILDSDSDEDPLPSKLRKYENKNETGGEKKSKAGAECDDDDFAAATKTQNDKKSKVKIESLEGLAKESRTATRAKPEILKPTTADHYFGSDAVHRSDRKTAALKRKNSSEEDPVCGGSVLSQIAARDDRAEREKASNGSFASVKKARMVTADDDDSDAEEPIEPTPPSGSTLASKLSRKISAAKFDKKSETEDRQSTSPRKPPAKLVDSTSLPEVKTKAAKNEAGTPLRVSPRKPPAKLVKATSSPEVETKSAKSEAITPLRVSPRKPPAKLVEANSAGKFEAKVGKSEADARHRASPRKSPGKIVETKPSAPAVSPSPKVRKQEVDAESDAHAASLGTVKTPVAARKIAAATGVDTPATGRKSAGTAVSSAGSAPPSSGEKRKGFWSYVNREGPVALGSKDLPEGAENCLEGLTFVITGVLDSFERDQVQDCIQRHGGKVTTNVSGKTSYVVVGREPGQSKMDKALKHKTHQLNEDEFIELVKTRPGKKTSFDSPGTQKSAKSRIASANTPSTTPCLTSEKAFEPPRSSSYSSPSQKSYSQDQSTAGSLGMSPRDNKSQFSQGSLSMESPGSLSSDRHAASLGQSSMLWVDKYKPKALSKVVGQSGEKSNAAKLRNWLLSWFDNNQTSANKPKGGFFAGKENGSIFKAALLSGPPGVGKTTTATLACEDVHYSYVELNASDTRGKKALESVVKESLSNTTVDGLLQGGLEESRNHVLIMDEVDGMAGNEDRGGVQELIQLIKKSRIPIICMCNDRNHPKIRSLANYCFDLRFYKPRVEQIKAFALSVASKEGLKIPQQAMEQIVIGANQDIRQVLHNLQMWTANTNALSYDEAKTNAEQAAKNIKLGPFECVRQLLSVAEASKMNIHEKTDLFFMDYSFIPLFMQENYISTSPALARGNPQKVLDLVSEAADAMADSTLVERSIRGSQNWSLLPLQGYFSTVLPSNNMAGHLGQQIAFPQWLGKNSSQGKHDRILQELKTHMALSSFANKSDINMEYLSVLKRALVEPLLDLTLEANEAAKHVMSLMDAYHLTREDWDSIMEIGKWGSEPDLVAKIPSKVKSAFTRQYNKESHRTPYAIHQGAKRVRGAKASVSEGILAQEGEEEEIADAEEEEVEDDSEDVSKDAMISVKKEGKKEGAAGGSGKGKAKAKAVSQQLSSSRGRGRGRGKK